MLRAFRVMLLAFACSCAGMAHAAQQYREVWNPPEARHAPRVSRQAAHRPALCPLSARRTTKFMPARVTAKGAKSVKRVHASRPVSLNAAPRVEILPPQSTPEGNILRVDSRGAEPEVMR